MKKITLFIAVLLFTAFNYSAQAVESQTAACTAGNLATVAASYLTTVTNLTVTGTIDARDFKTMRDAMPLLAVIDLSASNIETYDGTEGPSGNTSTVYPPNGIPELAFCDPSNYNGKTSLKSFIFPSSVTTIGDYAFFNCRYLTGSLTIPSLVTTIGTGAFRECWGLNGTLTISSSVTTIGERAFSGCSGISGSLTIPSSVKTIENCAFQTCIGFTGSLTIPSSVITIGEDAFQYSSGSITVDAANANYSSLDGMLFNKTKTTLIHCPISNTGSLTIPSSVTTIGGGAFYNCSDLTGSLLIPSSVAIIEKNAFLGCSGFAGSLTIPSSVTTIGDQAFWNCTSLTSIYAYATTPIDISASVQVFIGVNQTTCTLHVPVGLKALYETKDQWKDFTNIVEDIPNSLEEISTNAITIFPNPATTYISISDLGSLVRDKKATLSITDLSGSTLFFQDVEPSISITTIDVSSLKRGIYFIAIQTSNGRVVKRFIKE